MNHKKVLRLMQRLGIQSRIRRKRRSSSSYAPAQRVAENLLKRDFRAKKPNQKWVTDITQYRVGENWVYLSAIKDLFNNEIVAYEIGERNDNELVLRTFNKAFAEQKDVTGMIVHSDQGFQYTSHAYHDMLPKAPESACLAEEIVMTMPLWRVFSRISKRKDSILRVSERLPKHKAKSKNISFFTTENGHNEN
ncbi:integrase-like protein [Paenibacillus pabuli]|uniref:Integrase-like protein n=1 Tax=Paenibacillus pabuli TaxID=1472 RepID=A0ABX9BLP7_9BACL|nr:DDE-type integrase/transposase/recombinase [Paenibacillus pabuli]RAI97952.1 integrase-like protein [Paenibacillus pabuli]